MFLIEGRKLVREALQSSWKVEAILVREDKVNDFSASFLGENDAFWLSDEQFSQVNQLQQAEGIMAVVHLPRSKEFTHIKGPALLLEEIQDPGNMGTLIRTAAWFGIKQVYCSKGCVDVFNAKTLRASMGGIFGVEVFVLEKWEECVEEAKEKVFLAHMEGKDLSEEILPSDALILIGNEANGVGERWRNDSNINKVSIPGAAQLESLNAAVAGSIICWELFQRQKR